MADAPAGRPGAAPRTGALHFAVRCRDVAGSGPLREASLDAHRRYVDARADMIALSGPLVAEDGATRCGQLFVLAVASREAAEAFVADDPFTRAGVFAAVEIDALLPVFGNGRPG
ncbi:MULTISPECIES: YciI family protein [Actinomadura]|uniref:YciI family protein n=1 Tax=Actinomadura yumaensis TaxID=111807 RepID=A0ABW2D126_9ACTN|nr:YciI family protein [Actinomadura sp. J1-007]MWK34175.1 hypothetical protein [Actinomadura sp. J1-007]